jgi:hypothetical protein
MKGTFLLGQIGMSVFSAAGSCIMKSMLSSQVNKVIAYLKNPPEFGSVSLLGILD